MVNILLDFIKDSSITMSRAGEWFITYILYENIFLSKKSH